MPDVSFSLTHNLVLLAAVVAGAVAVSIASYRSTTPPIPKSRRRILSSLRAAILVLLFLFLGEPIISFVTRLVRPPVIVVLVDDSRSLTISDRTGSRSEQLQRVLLDPAFRSVSDIGDIRYVTFGELPREVVSFAPDSLTHKADQTDITGALHFARSQSLAANVQGVILITDGNTTTGGNPVFDEDAGLLPVFAVAIGDTAEQRDVLIRNVMSNAVVYQGTRAPVRVQIRSSGARGERVSVILRNESAVLDNRQILLQPGVRDYPVDLTWVPERSGAQRLTVTVGALEDELTERNNRAGFSARVLESRLKVTLIASAPDPDVAFFKRGLEADSNLSVTLAVERGDGRFYEPGLPESAVLEEQDVLILAGFPGEQTSDESIRRVVQAAQKGVGVLFIPSRGLHMEKLVGLIPILPLTIEQVLPGEQTAFLHPIGSPRDVFLRLPETLPRDAWSALPPLFVLQSRFRSKPESEVHAVQRIRNVSTNEPLLISRHVNNRKSVAMLGYGLWRWEMLSGAPHRDLFAHWLTATIRWLSTHVEQQRIRIAPAREVFTSGEPIDISGQLYDETMRPIERAEILLTIRSRTDQFEIPMDAVGGGQYEAHLRSLPEGDYRYTADIRADGETLGQTTGAFTVGESNAEFIETRTNVPLLRQLAFRSGGRLYRPDDLTGLPEHIRSLPGFREREVIVSSDLALWNSQWSLLLVVSLLAVEWLLRKQSGLL